MKLPRLDAINITTLFHSFVFLFLSLLSPTSTFCPPVISFWILLSYFPEINGGQLVGEGIESERRKGNKINKCSLVERSSIYVFLFYHSFILSITNCLSFVI